MDVCNGFDPIVPDAPDSAKLLILGTMPSVESLNQSFYYAHPRNAFWPILSALLGQELLTVEQKIHALKSAGILLWDVLASCERSGSLDSAIKKPLANDFTWIFKHHPHIKTIVFNGKSAEALFRRHVYGKQNLPSDLTLMTLPSTSPANARLTLEDKRLLWQEKLSDLL